MVKIRSFIEGVSLAESKNSHDFVSRKEPVFTATVNATIIWMDAIIGEFTGIKKGLCICKDAMGRHLKRLLYLDLLHTPLLQHLFRLKHRIHPLLA